MVMTDPTVIAAAIVTVLTALAALIVTVINAKASADERRDARASRVRIEATTASTNRNTDTIIEKAEEIHTLTNSNLTAVTKALKEANEKIAALEKLVGTLVNRKGTPLPPQETP
jgi:cell division protein FtsX